MIVSALLALLALGSAIAAIQQSFSSILQSRDNTTTGISEELFKKFKLFPNFTAAAYCPGNENGKSSAGSLISCTATAPCPLVEADSVTSIVEFGNDSTSADIKGYIALDPVKLLVVVAFAGSGATIRDWVADFEFIEVSYDVTGCDSCSIHSGFSTGWSERRTVVLDAVATALASYPGFSIIVTGHSIGAVVATLAGVELRSLNYSVDIYTFGSQRVGNAAFASFVISQSPSLGENFRMRHLNDSVPQLPPSWMDYEHTSPEYWLSDRTDTTDDYNSTDVVICTGLGNADCNAGTGLIPIDGTAHSHYLGGIDLCQGSLSW